MYKLVPLEQVKIEVTKEHYSLIRKISKDWKDAKKEIYASRSFITFVTDIAKSI